jgi:hypothetical protein
MNTALVANQTAGGHALSGALLGRARAPFF